MQIPTVLSPTKFNEMSSHEVPTPLISPVGSPKVGKVTPEPEFVCYVCRRRLASAEMLQKHEQLSSLHEKNLRNLRAVNQRKKGDLRSDVIRLRSGPDLPHTELADLEAQLGRMQEELESALQAKVEVGIGGWSFSMSGVSWVGNKPTNEDRMVLGFEVLEDRVVGCLVADGHCGDACADYVVEHLVRNLRGSLLKRGNEVNGQSLSVAVMEAFRTTDSAWMDFAVANQVPAGSTVVVGIFFLSSDADGGQSHAPPHLSLLVAHLGDSRGLMVNSNSFSNVIRLTEDHKPDRPDEHARLALAGGHVVDVGGVWRVFTPGIVSIGGRALQWGLAVSRAFGDLALKLPVPIVSAVPEIRVYDHVDDEATLVFACDGIFDVLSDEETMRAAMDGGPASVLRTSYGKLSDDNLTAVVVRVTRKLTAEPLESALQPILGKHELRSRRVSVEPSPKKRRVKDEVEGANGIEKTDEILPAEVHAETEAATDLTAESAVEMHAKTSLHAFESLPDESAELPVHPEMHVSLLEDGPAETATDSPPPRNNPEPPPGRIAYQRARGDLDEDEEGN